MIAVYFLSAPLYVFIAGLVWQYAKGNWEEPFDWVGSMFWPLLVPCWVVFVVGKFLAITAPGAVTGWLSNRRKHKIPVAKVVKQSNRP